MNHTQTQLIGWSAYANRLLMVANMVTLLLMFTVNPMWGPGNDTLSVPWMLTFLPWQSYLRDSTSRLWDARWLWERPWPV